MIPNNRRSLEERVRRGAASLVLGLSLLVASFAWSGFVMLNTVLDPGRSERLADEMLENPLVRGVIIDAIASSVEQAIPAEVPVPRAELEAAATAALADERVEALVRDGMVRVHQNALEGIEEPVTLDATAFGAASRDALVAARPELGAVLPPAPPVAVTLPDAGLSVLGTVRDFLERVVTLTATVAAAGAILALLITRDRPGVLRRVSLWAFAASAFWLIVAFGGPWLADRLAPGSAAVFAAAVEVFLGAMIPPALGLAAAGAGLIAVSFVWDAAARGATSRPEPRRREVEQAPRRRPEPQAAQPRRTAAPAPAPAHHAGARSGGSDATTWLPTAGPAGADPWDLTSPPPAVRRAPLPPDDPWSWTEPDDAPPTPERRPTRWVEGVGYVEG